MSTVTFQTPTLETERLLLRAPKFEDFAAFHDYFTSPRAAFTGGPLDTPRKVWNVLGHVTGMWALRGYGSFIITQKGDDTAKGMTGPWHPINWPERELGWTCFDPALEGTGMMFEAASAARDFAFGDLGWDTAVSYIDLKNTRSIRLAERLGAAHDPDAAHPEAGDDIVCHVYRHPRPAEVAA